jgi:uncharacterized membrane protein (DUF4010 family)
MYLRLWVLIRLFAPPMAQQLIVLFCGLGIAVTTLGIVVARLQRDRPADEHDRPNPTNPLELSSAFTFAGIFLMVLIATRMVADRFGGTGVLVMAVIMGAADVDPFVLGLTQQLGLGLTVETAALAVVLAAAANNLMKGVYALIFGAKTTGRIALAALTATGAVSLLLMMVAW